MLRDGDLAAAFDHASPTYDLMTAASPGYRAHLRRSARRLGLPGGGAGLTLLDLGCGTGTSTEALLRELLELTARDLVHGAYGLEGDKVVLTDTLELENLDFNEFEASFDSITLALAQHLGALAPYRE